MARLGSIETIRQDVYEKYKILLESERWWTPLRGFFASCDWEFNGEEITIIIPFEQGGARILEDKKTPARWAGVFSS